MEMVLLETVNLLLKNKKTIVKAAKRLSVAFLIAISTFLGYQNKKLSEGLQTAFNDIEAYQGILEGMDKENVALTFTLDQLRNSNDSLLNELVEVGKQNNIKDKQINTAATQTQTISVNGSKGVRGDLVEIIRDTVYSDTLKFNELTSVSYTIGKDSVHIGLDINNKQYLYVYSKKEYKNKKNFFKRLITLDFKKVKKTEYKIVDTNDLIKTSDVRVIELNK